LSHLPFNKIKKNNFSLTIFDVSMHDVSEKGPGQIRLEKRCKLTLRYMTFCAYCSGTNFGVMLVPTSQSLR